MTIIYISLILLLITVLLIIVDSLLDLYDSYLMGILIDMSYVGSVITGIITLICLTLK